MCGASRGSAFTRNGTRPRDPNCPLALWDSGPAGRSKLTTPMAAKKLANRAFRAQWSRKEAYQ